ncbi:crotonase/enoyl-CoA hydratase family protein [Bradyrhizobium sp. KB893862 SZCCT0404]|uniref:crotonase/enoyl-CoA hydratase family protein n=1 Tax=Bradyrhizobium sp. KB893862 SZCCT0404 TaxID=2807672 RepID=UPI001BA78F32|nr:crotonase/enoyl-CoA hydratase family protein [Bradyrhizobium sp. KB893862 SZCCT0404]MBR1177008.1 crotonase/enoyl-CoA hydratase family protein [Bradyrhizobium sp. KB893862 SZCCT0404]
MSSELVSYELEGNIAVLGLNRPDKRNALNDDVLKALSEAVMRAGEEADAGVIFGHGPNFSAGLDLAQLAERLRPDAPRDRKRKRYIWHTTFDLIARGTIPFVAALHGATIGGGLELAAAAHIRVADETTTIGLPEGQRGIFVGGGGSVRIQRIIGYATMADLMLTGRMLSAEQAHEVRLVQYVVGSGYALDKAKQLASKIAQNTAQTNWQITNVLPRMNDLSHDDGLFMEYLNTAMVRPPETVERLKQFLEKKAKPLAMG